MSEKINQYISEKIQQRKDDNNFRSLSISKNLIDFYSNDYLGFARDRQLQDSIKNEIDSKEKFSNGSTGSRLLSGNSEYIESLEKSIADFHNAESALIFNSGFDANYGLISSLPYRGQTIFYDELVHASIHDGIRNSKANAVSFAHNSFVDLEAKLAAHSGLKYVVVESVYSMDGDFAPLVEISKTCERYDAGLIVDEAHATGIFGQDGRGRVCELKLQDKCLARIHTFSKALGAHGAAILSSPDLKNFLINYCRPFIFSTALPYHSLIAINCGYNYLLKSERKRAHLNKLIALFQKSVVDSNSHKLLKSHSPIQSVFIQGNTNVKEFANRLVQQGFDVRPILYPTVPKGKERIRICIHSFNTEEEVAKLAGVVNVI
jgi:8-amino-7-oxononanoate synthase